MEIIKRGKIPSDKVYDATCNNCKSVIRFKQNEGKVTYDQRDGHYVTIKCPVCNQDIHHNI